MASTQVTRVYNTENNDVIPQERPSTSQRRHEPHTVIDLIIILVLVLSRKFVRRQNILQVQIFCLCRLND